MPKATIYTRTTCGPCRTVKHWFKTKNVDYVEKNVEDPSVFEEMLQKTGMTTVPQTLVGDRVVTGPHFSLLSELLML